MTSELKFSLLKGRQAFKLQMSAKYALTSAVIFFIHVPKQHRSKLRTLLKYTKECIHNFMRLKKFHSNVQRLEQDIYSP